MEAVNILYLSDYEGGKALSDALVSIGFDVSLIAGRDFSDVEINQDEPHLIVIDCPALSPERLIPMIIADTRLQNYQKFIIMSVDKTDEAIALSGDILHIDFISRPFNKRELLILLEKAVLVEQYRNMMKAISRDAEDRIGEFESIMHTHKKNMLDTKSENEAFDRIMTFEKKMIEEQKKLNEAIRDFTALRHKELFDLKSRLRAEELLDAFRRSEMLDAHDMIWAQQVVIDLSTKELGDARNIIKAAEINGELSREEAIALHEKLNSERERNTRLSEELDALRKRCAPTK